MRDRAGAITCLAACLGFLAILVWPFLVKHPYAIATYYGWGVLNPLFAGALVVAILVVFAAIRGGYVSQSVGAGAVLGLALVAFLVALVWAVTARLDVFRAPGWALPAQRFVLVGVTALLVLGAAWHARTNGLRSPV